VLTVNPQGLITEANRAFLEMLDYSREDLPLVPAEITPPEWVKCSDKASLEIAERGVAAPFEKEYLHKDGHRVRVLVGAAALADSSGEVLAFVVDLSARQHAELEFERMRGFLDSIVENLPTMMFVKDARELRFVQFNRAGEALLGFRRDELLGKNDYDFFPRVEADAFTANDRAVLATRALLDIPEEPIQTKSGEVRILHTKKVPILDRDGTPRYLLGISEDITERKRSEQQMAKLNNGLQRRTAELEAANQELEAFSYSVSHDLRAPLRHIDGFADLLLRHARAVLDDKGQRYLETISGSAKSMGRLIDDLLAFSRMSRTQMQDTRVDLGELVASVRQDLTEATGNAEWRIAPLPGVQGDAAMLRQAVANLLANALKYAGRGQRPVIEVGTLASDDEEIVFVRDNGVGFDMKYAHKLFGVFQRLHSSDEFEGTGIGLAIVRRVISRHGGRVWAEGVVNGGATFFLALPKCANGEGLKEAA
jgi:PAS domain S-box-containing protein